MIKFDKTGAAFEIDHEVGDTTYVRPMIKIVTQSASYHGDDYSEKTDFEPADFMVARNATELFEAPPVELIDDEILAKRQELHSFVSGAKQQKDAANAARLKAERQLSQAQKNLEDWTAKHSVMTDLGKLLDGVVLYPLSVSENVYHKARNIPRIPEMRGAKYLTIRSGNFETGQKWTCESNSRDNYGSPFRFFDTEEERSAVVAQEFDETCDQFRKKPAFQMPTWTAETRLSYTTLKKWVQAHPSLSVPSDIVAMNAKSDAQVAQKERDQLAAKLAELDGATQPHTSETVQ
tara:strand:- start:2488 stop:3363 length:876 start_codon:yes stop_codon:yes gene_type:complete